tara:strand:- start:1152 stop:1415 length:264 start_codon:yes stop_codon:yes gene_type:complete
MGVKVNYMDMIELYTKQFKENVSIKDVVYQLVKDNLIDKREMRNRSIIRDYNELIKDSTITINEIMETLSYKYNLSTRMIQEIIYKK